MQIYKNISLEDIPGEEWLPVPGYEDSRLLSNYGRIKMLKSRKNKCPCIANQTLSTKGYPETATYKINGANFTRPHRMVGLLFVPNPHNHKEINHKDGDKTNNYYKNLEWCTRSYNMKHMIEQTGPGHRVGSTNPKARMVLHTEYGVYFTMSEAAEIHGCGISNMSMMVREVGYRKNKTKFILT